MKKIGKETLLLDTKEGNPRNGEGSFIRLSDGRIMYAYTEYVGDSHNDHARARISAVFSSDEGESFGEGRVLVETPEGALNVMSVSLLKMENGDIGLFYLVKEAAGDKIFCNPVLLRSGDDALSFSAPAYPIDERSYYVLNNDRVIRLSTGRIIFPVAEHKGLTKELLPPGVIKIYYSDDDGVSFKKARCDVFSPIADNIGFREPGLFELPDGRVWLYIRTRYGRQYQAFSEDGGSSWSSPEPSPHFPSPDSPMLARCAGKYSLAIFTPFASEVGIKVDTPHKRTPYYISVSEDGGESFVRDSSGGDEYGIGGIPRRTFYLEDDLTNTYCYPAVIEVKDGFLVAYYHSNGSGRNLNANKIIKVNYTELEG